MKINLLFDQARYLTVERIKFYINIDAQTTKKEIIATFPAHCERVLSAASSKIQHNGFTEIECKDIIVEQSFIEDELYLTEYLDHTNQTLNDFIRCCSQITIDLYDDDSEELKGLNLIQMNIVANNGTIVSPLMNNQDGNIELIILEGE